MSGLSALRWELLCTEATSMQILLSSSSSGFMVRYKVNYIGYGNITQGTMGSDDHKHTARPMKPSAHTYIRRSTHGPLGNRGS